VVFHKDQFLVHFFSVFIPHLLHLYLLILLFHLTSMLTTHNSISHFPARTLLTRLLYCLEPLILRTTGSPIIAFLLTRLKLNTFLLALLNKEQKFYHLLYLFMATPLSHLRMSEILAYCLTLTCLSLITYPTSAAPRFTKFASFVKYAPLSMLTLLLFWLMLLSLLNLITVTLFSILFQPPQ
jgi:hypothetical protein